MTENEIREAFKASSLLSGLDVADFDVTVRDFKTGEQPDDSPDGVPSIGLVVAGLLDAWSVAPDGSSALLNVLGSGDCFGISNLLETEPLTTSLRSAGGCRVAYIPKTQIERALRSDSLFALRYASVCNRKLQFLLRRIALLTAQTSRGRLLSFLLYHMQGDGTVRFMGSKEDLAISLSMSRATLYRELQALQSEGILTFNRKALIVTDRDALEKMLFHQTDMAEDK